MAEGDPKVTENGVLQMVFHLAKGHKGGKCVQPGPAPPQRRRGKTPRISKLIALAHHLESLVETGKVRDMTRLADLANVKKPRITQVINLKYLAPEIQDELLHLPLTLKGRDIINERQVRPIAAELEWTVQMQMWRELKKQVGLQTEIGGAENGSGETDD